MAVKKQIGSQIQNQTNADKSIEHIPDSAVYHATATSNNYLTYKDIIPDITVGNEYNDKSYYQFRENERIPTKPKAKMSMALYFYGTNPIVKNTIDMMSELAADGMVVAHKSEKIQ